MSPMIRLKEAERKAWTIHFEDGLLDLLLGSFLLVTGLRNLTDILWYYLLGVLGLLVYLLGKQFITIPRIGLVNFGSARKAQKKRLLLLISITLAATLTVLLLILSGQTLPESLLSLIFILIVPIIFFVTAYTTDFERLYLYGIFSAVIVISMETLGNPTGAIIQIILGGITLIIGLFYIVRFILRYPIPQPE